MDCCRVERVLIMERYTNVGVFFIVSTVYFDKKESLSRSAREEVAYSRREDGVEVAHELIW